MKLIPHILKRGAICCCLDFAEGRQCSCSVVVVLFSDGEGNPVPVGGEAPTMYIDEDPPESE